MDTRNNWRRIVEVVGLFLWDSVSIFLSYVLIILIRFGGQLPPANRSDTFLVLSIGCVTTIVALALYNGYRDMHRPFVSIVGSCIISVSIGTLLAMASAYVFRAPSVPRSLVLGALPLQSVLLCIGRVVSARAARRWLANEQVVVVTRRSDLDGLNGDSEALLYLQVVRAVTPEELLAGDVKLQDSNVVLYIADDLKPGERYEVFEWAVRRGLGAYVSPIMSDLLIRYGSLVRFGDHPLFSVPRLGIPVVYAPIKRLIDITGSLLLLTIFSPLFIIVPILNRLFCPGPTFYAQERVGLNGKVFRMLKFRSMIPDAEKKTGAVLAKENDDRITPVGRVLRATRLDEIPQLINVLKGEMSLVGPRPERPVFVEQYCVDNPDFRLRQMVKPGLTGLAQVMGRYDTTPDNKLRFDLIYIASYSPLLDLQILIWTVQTVLFPQKWEENPPKWVRAVERRLVSGATGTEIGL